MANMQKMAANMYGGSTGGMPGMGMGGMPGALKEDLDASDKLKVEADTFYKQKKYDEACAKYFSAINIIRMNAELAKTKEGKDKEMVCRNNLAMSKL